MANTETILEDLQNVFLREDVTKMIPEGKAFLSQEGRFYLLQIDHRQINSATGNTAGFFCYKIDLSYIYNSDNEKYTIDTSDEDIDDDEGIFVPLSKIKKCLRHISSPCPLIHEGVLLLVPFSPIIVL